VIVVEMNTTIETRPTMDTIVDMIAVRIGVTTTIIEKAIAAMWMAFEGLFSSKLKWNSSQTCNAAAREDVVIILVMIVIGEFFFIITLL
jgi:hypothetical protein